MVPPKDGFSLDLNMDSISIPIWLIFWYILVKNNHFVIGPYN
jgi:hypothetical protein